ncbi:unnamed protein product [Protopolystoma xenopodis]|uniref:Uncharacterized protein n=1 Tax=Protopolystoma xenopodis TaxID=117903 RepID=A0A448XDN0_9PLAT|nr:unnamed protein product [Protopolystoma xenopodis]
MSCSILFLCFCYPTDGSFREYASASIFNGSHTGNFFPPTPITSASAGPTSLFGLLAAPNSASLFQSLTQPQHQQQLTQPQHQQQLTQPGSLFPLIGLPIAVTAAGQPFYTAGSTMGTGLFLPSSALGSTSPAVATAAAVDQLAACLLGPTDSMLVGSNPTLSGPGSGQPGPCVSSVSSIGYAEQLESLLASQAGQLQLSPQTQLLHSQQRHPSQHHNLQQHQPHQSQTTSTTNVLLPLLHQQLLSRVQPKTDFSTPCTEPGVGLTMPLHSQSGEYWLPLRGTMAAAAAVAAANAGVFNEGVLRPGGIGTEGPGVAMAGMANGVLLDQYNAGSGDSGFCWQPHCARGQFKVSTERSSDADDEEDDDDDERIGLTASSGPI